MTNEEARSEALRRVLAMGGEEATLLGLQAAADARARALAALARDGGTPLRASWWSRLVRHWRCWRTERLIAQFNRVQKRTDCP